MKTMIDTHVAEMAPGRKSALDRLDIAAALTIVAFLLI